MIDTFTGWIEGFPTQTEKAEEVVKKKKKKNNNNNNNNKQKKLLAPWNNSEIWSAQVTTKWQWDIIYF